MLNNTQPRAKFTMNRPFSLRKVMYFIFLFVPDLGTVTALLLYGVALLCRVKSCIYNYAISINYFGKYFNKGNF